MSSKHHIIRLNICSIVLLIAFFIVGCGASMTASMAKMPPGEPFKQVSSLVKLPDYLPGLGSLYVDPSTLPAGPFLGYDKSGKLVHITYMIPLNEMNNNKNFSNLGTSASGFTVNHTDIVYNPGHPGVAQPHYHVSQWLISRDAKKKL